MATKDSTPRLGVAELERRFRELTYLLYDTRVPLGQLAEQVYRYLSPDIEFVDPLVRVRGDRIFKVGLRGFHCVIRFDFEIFQLHVQMSERGDRARVLVDGVMNLRQLVVYTYPLRTILVYEVVLTEGGTNFQITRLEEMWSLGDLLENLPLVGRIYDVFRVGFGHVIAVPFWLSCIVARRLRPSLDR